MSEYNGTQQGTVQNNSDNLASSSRQSSSLRCLL